MDDLVTEFITETVESLSALDLDLVRLEQEPENKDLLGNIFRLMHTIKGTCGFIGLPRLEKTAHAAENLLDNFRNEKMDVSERAMTLLFMCIDRVRFLVSEVSKSGSEPDGNDSDIIQVIEAEIEQSLRGDVKKDAMSSVVDPVPDPAVSVDVPSTQVVEKGAEYLRVQMNVLEDLINMVSELVLTRNQLSQLIRMEENSNLTTPFQRLNRIVSDLQDSVMKTRMQPIGNAWSKLPRIVRDLSTEMKKKIVLEMEGEETELDRQVLEQIKDPLTHMIRNSCDHGIERPADRLEAGKKEQGCIRLRAYHEGGFIVLQISDDGKGLDPVKIAEKAIEKGLAEPEKIQSMSDKQILSYIMRPGFSTAEQITNVSGRGVGMDVVRANIEKIGGSIDMESTPGKGTCFTIQIPLTLAIISALIVEIDSYRYAIPQMNIQELVSINSTDSDMIEYINDKPVLRLRDRIIPLLDSEALFDCKNDCEHKPHNEKLICVISAGSSYYGILVDQIYDTEEVVIKSVSSVLKNAGIFSGNTILGDGRVIMILDPAAIARKFNVEKAVSQLEAENVMANQAREGVKERASMLVFKAGDGALRAVPLALVSRIQVFPRGEITCSADKIVVRYNNTLMQLCFIDAATQGLNDHEVMSLVLSDDMSEASMGLIIDHVVDIIEGDLDLTTATLRPGILGSMILSDRTVDVIDIAHFLSLSRSDWFSKMAHQSSPYANYHIERVHEQLDMVETGPHTQRRSATIGELEHAAMAHRPVTEYKGQKMRLLVVDDSPFFRSMLYPILTSAGYDVTLSEDPLHAIRLHDDGHMFDIVLSDIEMPHMDGYEFVEKMRDDSSWKDVPFIAITSHNTREDIEYGYKKGFNKYIGKFDKDELIRSLVSIRNNE
ncbi:hybrid sensor histidine kinase/response regulator [Micavibrio aeruginosavorus]|uniref:histidine kinase n=1 Tax=Micavibrio aeruginosavorus EPB TaxID=349215 RepID=M4VD05_9BACT|nr:hybrid sensor histidine kinase/response regulator [Micavibrio aeruginosavorus]AGH97277.1 Signal transduction histidine kinase CheA [Micavibrio aeruginosavorus EPB]